MVMADNEAEVDNHDNKEVGGPKSPWKSPAAVDAEAPVMIGAAESWPALTDAQRPKIPDGAATKPLVTPAPPVVQVCQSLFFICWTVFFSPLCLIYGFLILVMCQKCALKTIRAYRECNCGGSLA